MKNRIKRPLAWGWIILAFIIFWPVGIILLFRRIATDKSAIMKNQKTVEIISYVLIGVGVLLLLSALVSDSGNFFPPVVLIIGAVWVRRIAGNMKTDAEKYKKYIALVANQSVNSIDYIASAVGVPYESAVKDLQKMIDAGYFANSFIDKDNRMIVLPKEAPRSALQSAAAQQAVQPTARVVSCNSCGANNTVFSGQLNECDYCGSPLQ